MKHLKAAWEWTKKNWHWIVFPVGIVLFLLGRISAPRRLTTTDPVLHADEVSEAEKRQRAEELAAENADLRKRLEDVRSANRAKLQELTDTQMEHAATLEDDPDALNAWLRSL